MALYVKCTSPAQIWAGSNINIPFDGTHVILEAYDDSPLPADGNPVSVAPIVDITWSILNAPEGTTYNQAWFEANNGGTLVGVNPLASGNLFIPDKAGTWLIRCTNTATTEVVDVVIGVLQERTGVRIPAPGETNQADTDTQNHNYPSLPSGSPSAMGWAKDRNYALDLFDQLITNAGLQLCYFDDAGGIGPAPWSGTLKTGAAVAITGQHTLATDFFSAGSGDIVPTVGLAHGTTNPDCIGLVYCGWEVPALVPNAPLTGQRVYPRIPTTTAIPNQSLILVSRTGSITAPIGGILNLVGTTVGELLYLGDTAGRLVRGTDRFAMATTPTTYVVPVAMVVEAANPGTVVVIPSEYWGGTSTASADQCFRYKGLSDFRGVRVGGPESTAVAGEMRGAIEMIATCKEAAGLAIGDVCMLYPDTAGTTNTAYKGDASLAAGTPGIVGVCIEAVLLDAVGHFVIYGPAQAKLSSAAQTESSRSTATELFVGSSDNTSGAAGAGICVTFEETGNRNASSARLKIIPVGAVVPSVGMATPNTIMVGKGTTDGIISSIHHGIATSAEESTSVVTSLSSGAITPNINSLVLQDGTATLAAGTDLSGRDNVTRIKFAGTGADDSLAEINLFESKLPGTSLWDSTGGSATALNGVSSTIWAIPGSILTNSEANSLYGTFCLDNRLRYADPTSTHYKSHQNDIYLKVYGYAVGNVSSVQLRSRIRFNAPADNTAAPNLPTTNDVSNDYPYLTVMLNLQPAQNFVYAGMPGLAADYRGFGIKCPLIDQDTFAFVAGDNSLSESRPNLGVLSPQTNTNTFSATTIQYGGFPNDFQRMIETVDIELTNMSAADFVVTEVVLQSRRRITGPELAGNAFNSQYRLSYFESSYPAYAYLAYDQDATTGGVFRIEKDATVLPSPGTDALTIARKAGIIGVPSFKDPAGNNVLHDVYGFIPIDPRLVNPGLDQQLVFTVYGKLSCPTPGTDTLGLKLEIVQVATGTDLNKVIASAAGVVTAVDSLTPVPSNPVTHELTVTKHSFTLPVTEPNDPNIIGFWFKVTRVDNATGGAADDEYNLGGTEVFWYMTNIKLEDLHPNGDIRDDIEKIPENIYEQHIPATSIINGDPAAGVFTKYLNSDVTGASLTQRGGAVDTLKFNAVLDERYDDKSGLIVDVLLSVDALVGVTDTFELQLEAGYKNISEVIVGAGAQPVDSEIYTNKVYTSSVVNTGAIAVNEIRYLKASFFIPSDQLWGDPADDNPQFNIPAYNSPNVNCSRDKGIIKFLLSRVDLVALDMNVLSVLVRGVRANKTKLSTVRPLRVGGSSNSRSMILTAPYIDDRRILDLSIQRKTLKFCVPSYFTQGEFGSDAALTPPNEAWDPTPNRLVSSTSVYLTSPYLASMPGQRPSNFSSGLMWGHLITHNFAITSISGWLGQYDVGGSDNLKPLTGGVGAGVQISLLLGVSEIPSRTDNLGTGPANAAGQQAVIMPKVLPGPVPQIAFPGIEGLPMYFFTNEVGILDWRPDSSTNGINTTVHSKIMPKVILPSLYHQFPQGVPTAGPVTNVGSYPWQLWMQLTNITSPGADLYPIGEIDVEIAILPNIQDEVWSDDEASIGGAPGSGRGF